MSTAYLFGTISLRLTRELIENRLSLLFYQNRMSSHINFDLLKVAVYSITTLIPPIGFIANKTYLLFSFESIKENVQKAISLKMYEMCCGQVAIKSLCTAPN